MNGDGYISKLSIEMCIGESTLYNWRKQAIDKGHLVPGDGNNADLAGLPGKFKYLAQLAASQPVPEMLLIYPSPFIVRVLIPENCH